MVLGVGGPSIVYYLGRDVSGEHYHKNREAKKIKLRMTNINVCVCL